MKSRVPSIVYGLCVALLTLVPVGLFTHRLVTSNTQATQAFGTAFAIISGNILVFSIDTHLRARSGERKALSVARWRRLLLITSTSIAYLASLSMIIN